MASTEFKAISQVADFDIDRKDGHFILDLNKNFIWKFQISHQKRL